MPFFSSGSLLNIEAEQDIGIITAEIGDIFQGDDEGIFWGDDQDFVIEYDTTAGQLLFRLPTVVAPNEPVINLFTGAIGTTITTPTATLLTNTESTICLWGGGGTTAAYTFIQGGTGVASGTTRFSTRTNSLGVDMDINVISPVIDIGADVLAGGIFMDIGYDTIQTTTSALTIWRFTNAAALTLGAFALTGMNIDFNTNVTAATLADVTGYRISMPALTQSAANTTTYIGFRLPTAGALVQDTAAGVINWYGMDIVTPTLINSFSGGCVVTGFRNGTAGAITQNTAAGSISWFGSNIALPNGTQTTGTVLIYGHNLAAGTLSVAGGTSAGLFSAFQTTTPALTLGVALTYTIEAFRVVSSGNLETNTAAGTINWRGINLSESVGTILSNFAGSTVDWRGLAITSPAATQTFGAVAIRGIDLDMDAVITTGGTVTGINLIMQNTYTSASEIGMIIQGDARLTHINTTSQNFLSRPTTIDTGVDVAIDSLASPIIDIGADIFNQGIFMDIGYDTAETTEGALTIWRFTNAAALTLGAFALTGMNIDFNTNVTAATLADVTGYRISMPALTQSAANTTNYYSFIIPTAGALVQNTLAGTINWRGFRATTPNLTATTGTLSTVIYDHSGVNTITSNPGGTITWFGGQIFSPALSTNDATLLTHTIRGWSLVTSGALVTNHANATINWEGLYIVTPNITQTLGAINSYALRIQTGTTTTGGLQRAIDVDYRASQGTIFNIAYGAATTFIGASTGVNLSYANVTTGGAGSNNITAFALNMGGIAFNAAYDGAVRGLDLLMNMTNTDEVIRAIDITLPATATSNNINGIIIAGDVPTGGTSAMIQLNPSVVAGAVTNTMVNLLTSGTLSTNTFRGLNIDLDSLDPSGAASITALRIITAGVSVANAPFIGAIDITLPSTATAHASGQPALRATGAATTLGLLDLNVNGLAAQTIIDIDHVGGVLTGAFTGFDLGFTGATTLGGTATGIALNISSNITVSNQRIDFINMNIPAAGTSPVSGIVAMTTDALDTRGIYIRSQDSDTATYNGAFVCADASTPFTGNVTFAITNTATIDMNPRLLTAGQILIDIDHNGGVLLGAFTGFDLAFANATTLGGTTTGINLNLTTNVTPGANAVIGQSMLIPASSSASSRGLDIDYRATAGTLFEGAIGAATTLTGTLYGMALDLQTNLTINSGGTVFGYQLASPAHTQSVAATTTIYNIGVTSSGALVTNTDVNAIINWYGSFVQLPVITQTLGTLSSYGFYAAGTQINVGGDQTGFFAIMSNHTNNVGNSYGMYIRAAGTSNGLGAFFGRTTAFTGVAAATGYEVRIDPNFTLTAPGAGTYNHYGLSVENDGITLTSGAGALALYNIFLSTPGFTQTTAVTSSIFGISLSNVGALTQTTLAGIINFRGINLNTPALTNQVAATSNVFGSYLSVAGALTVDTAAGTTNWYGNFLVFPAATNNFAASTINMYGLVIGGSPALTNTAGNAILMEGINVDLSGVTLAAGSATIYNIYSKRATVGTAFDLYFGQAYGSINTNAKSIQTNMYAFGTDGTNPTLDGGSLLAHTGLTATGWVAGNYAGTAATKGYWTFDAVADEAIFSIPVPELMVDTGTAAEWTFSFVYTSSNATDRYDYAVYRVIADGTVSQIAASLDLALGAASGTHTINLGALTFNKGDKIVIAFRGFETNVGGVTTSTITLCYFRSKVGIENDTT